MYGARVVAKVLLRHLPSLPEFQHRCHQASQVEEVDLVCYQFSGYSSERFHIFRGVAGEFTELIFPFVPFILHMHGWYPLEHTELVSVNCETGTK